MYDTENANLVLCDNLEGWDEVGRRFKREGIYIYTHIPMADPC